MLLDTLFFSSKISVWFFYKVSISLLRNAIFSFTQSMFSCASLSSHSCFEIHISVITQSTSTIFFCLDNGLYVPVFHVSLGCKLSWTL